MAHHHLEKMKTSHYLHTRECIKIYIYTQSFADEGLNSQVEKKFKVCEEFFQIVAPTENIFCRFVHQLFPPPFFFEEHQATIGGHNNIFAKPRVITCK